MRQLRRAARGNGMRDLKCRRIKILLKNSPTSNSKQIMAAVDGKINRGIYIFSVEALALFRNKKKWFV